MKGNSKVQTLITGFNRQVYATQQSYSQISRPLEGEIRVGLASVGFRSKKLDGMSPKSINSKKKSKGSSKSSKSGVRNCQSNRIKEYLKSSKVPTDIVGLEVGKQTEQLETGQAKRDSGAK